jgi:hypothetical protein
LPAFPPAGFLFSVFPSRIPFPVGPGRPPVSPPMLPAFDWFFVFLPTLSELLVENLNQNFFSKVFRKEADKKTKYPCPDAT